MHLLGNEYTGNEQEYSAQQRNEVIITGNKIFKHNALCVNYMMYDMLRDQDVLKPQSDFMILASEDETNYPYWYRRIVGIFHANIIYEGAGHSDKPQRMEFLWVWWFGQDLGSHYQDGWCTCHLPHIGFVPHDDPGTFGFLNLTLVIWAIHTIPVFSLDQTNSLLPSHTVAHPEKDKDEDWAMYYINM